MSPTIHDGLSLDDEYFEGLEEKLGKRPPAGPPEVPRVYHNEFVRTSRTFHRSGCKALNPSMCGGIERRGIWAWPDHEMSEGFEPIAFGRQIVQRGRRSLGPWPCRVCLPECWEAAP